MSPAPRRVDPPERLRLVVTVPVDALLALRGCRLYGVSPDDKHAIEIFIGTRSVGTIHRRHVPQLMERLGIAATSTGWRYELAPSGAPEGAEEHDTLPPPPGYGAPISPREPTRRSGARPIDIRPGHRLMVVEDEPAMRALLLRRFSSAGITCVAFAGAVRAVSFAKAQPKGVELALVTKHELGQIPGAVLASCVRRTRARSVPTVVFSSAHVASAIPLPTSDGVYAVLGAPLDVDGLVAATLEMLASCARRET